MTDRCGTCRFWEHDPTIRGIEGTEWGDCKRFPPRTVRTDTEYAFVQTPNYEWCGEHKEK